MCLNVLKGYKTPRIAKENMTVYKRMCTKHKSKHLVSPFQGFIYLRNNMYTSKLDPVIAYRFHPFEDSFFVAKLKSETHTVVGEIEKGIHAYTSKETAEYRAEGWYGETIVECTIPKGAKYHLGTGNEIVTNKLYIGKL